MSTSLLISGYAGLGGEMATPISQNLYLYVEGDPVNHIDPSGHAPLGIGQDGESVRQPPIQKLNTKKKQQTRPLSIEEVKPYSNTSAPVASGTAASDLFEHYAPTTNEAKRMIAQEIIDRVGNSGGKGTLLDDKLQLTLNTAMAYNRQFCSNQTKSVAHQNASPYFVNFAFAIPVWIIEAIAILLALVDGILPIGDLIVLFGAVIVDYLIRQRIIEIVDGYVVSVEVTTIIGDTDTLPNQGAVDAGVEGAPDVDAGGQGKHVAGHNNHDSERSQWLRGSNGVKETQEAWLHGTLLPDGTKVWDTGRVVGQNGETGVRVSINRKGLIHGYPVDPQRYLPGGGGR